MSYRTGYAWKLDTRMGTFKKSDRSAAMEAFRVLRVKGMSDLEKMGVQIVPVVMVEIPELKVCGYECKLWTNGEGCCLRLAIEPENNGKHIPGPDCPAKVKP